jgi:tetratricopeptide (TPR) repeat protein
MIALGEATAFRDRDSPGVMLLYSGHNETELRGTADRAAVRQPGWYQRVERWSLFARYVRLSLISHVSPLFLGRRDLSTYENELRTTIETASEAGLVPMLSTAAGNLSGVEPSFGGNDAERARAAIEAALREQKDNGCVPTETRCKKRAQEDADIAALLCYEAAKCVQAGGDVGKARDLYWEAVDLDARKNWGRATRAQNALISRLTAEYRIPLVDAVALLEKESPSGILGDELFVDGQHPSLMGQIVVANAFAEAVAHAFDVPVARRFATAQDAMSAFDFTVGDECASHVLSAGWLLGMAAQHPWPEDALILAEAHTRSAIALVPDKFSAWLDLAVVQAARRGGLLRDADALEHLGKWNVFFGAAACVPAEDLDAALQRFRVKGADPDVLERIRGLRDASCRPEGALERF